jgi:hypothetical protein
MIDSVTFGQQVMDWSWGRYPNGTGPFGLMHGSFSATNYPVSAEETSLLTPKVWPNPTSDYFMISIPSGQNVSSNFELYHCDGKKMNVQFINTGDGLYRVDVSNLNSGLYILTFAGSEGVRANKLVIDKNK